MHSRLSRTVLKRPLSSLVGLGAAGGLTYVYYEDNKAYRLERQGSTPSLPREYSRKALHEYWSARPLTVAQRLLTVAYELGPCIGSYVVDFKLFPVEADCLEDVQKVHAVRLRETLTRLGPAFVKAGQQLSIRPDLVPATVLKELQKLCDSVEPAPDEIALRVLRDELQCEDLNTIFEDLHFVASASLGQVYKATLKESGDVVAIKVQRENMLQKFSLDLYLLQLWGVALDGLFTSLTKQTAYHEALFDTFSRSSYYELDYEHEAANQLEFKAEFAKRNCKVKIPEVYQDYTTRRVLVTEWITGTKLADAPKERIRELIPIGVELFLIQLLDFGRFHADPHPGNLYVTDDGTLCLLDFGLCSDITETARRAMTKAIVHLLTGDFDALVAEDAKELGFLPEDLDTEELKPILKLILTKGMLESGSDLHARKRKLMDISNELNDIFFKYPFSVSPFFALVTRGLGLLEGIALTGDPTFDIFKASLPYASRRAVSLLGARRTWYGLKKKLTIRAPARTALELE